jgi:hypothetical protein
VQADACGVGQGRLQAELANLTALVKVLAPVLYLRAYRWGTSRGFTSAPFILYALYFCTTGGIFATVPRRAL